MIGAFTLFARLGALLPWGEYVPPAFVDLTIDDGSADLTTDDGSDNLAQDL